MGGGGVNANGVRSRTHVRFFFGITLRVLATAVACEATGEVFELRQSFYIDIKRVIGILF